MGLLYALELSRHGQTFASRDHDGPDNDYGFGSRSLAYMP